MASKFAIGFHNKFIVIRLDICSTVRLVLNFDAIKFIKLKPLSASSELLIEIVLAIFFSP